MSSWIPGTPLSPEQRETFRRESLRQAFFHRAARHNLPLKAAEFISRRLPNTPLVGSLIPYLGTAWSAAKAVGSLGAAAGSLLYKYGPTVATYARAARDLSMAFGRRSYRRRRFGRSSLRYRRSAFTRRYRRRY